ncbi:hypothetical protein TrRE_jg5813 [Triparma retinervis]|uniref:Uncharacterized protein n=1 Tax=Triparma retinervis TaxID=2557542 RepID=A0A9W7DW68_9STRA|nr:hypothetical protein TrRE_jg5813 [Triparma retinervis]
MRQLLLILLVLFSVVPSSRADYNTWTNSCNDGHEPGGSTKQWRTRNTCKTRRTRVCDSVDKWGNRVTCSEETNRNPAEAYDGDCTSPTATPAACTLDYTYDGKCTHSVHNGCDRQTAWQCGCKQVQRGCYQEQKCEEKWRKKVRMISERWTRFDMVILVKRRSS